MARQLQLLESGESAPPEWRLDESTKQTGRKGVAAVRATLQKARREALQADRRHDAA